MLLEAQTGMETCRNVGFELWQARKAKGWTRAHASAISKLRVGQIEAIESNDFRALPPPAFLSKHLRDYARELGLDPRDIVGRYLDQFGIIGAPPEPAAAAPSSPPSRLSISPLRRIALAAVWLLAALFFSSPALSIIDAMRSDVASIAAEPPHSSFGAVRETTRSIAIASQLAH